MAASSSEIATLAISHLGISTPIAALATESSKEAGACRAFYDQTVDEVLRSAPWPFATRQVALALVGTDPALGWGYSYRVPADTLTVQGLVDPTGVALPVAYQLVGDAAGLLLWTNVGSASAQLTVRVTDPTRFDPLFVQAVAYQLAAYVGPRLTDNLALVDRAAMKAERLLLRARAQALNEAPPAMSPTSDLITVRGG